MSRSRNQHKTSWDAPKRHLKEATKSKMRSAEKRFLHRIKENPNYSEENLPEVEEELDDIWNYD
jgi:ribosomal protein S20